MRFSATAAPLAAALLLAACGSGAAPDDETAATANAGAVPSASRALPATIGQGDGEAEAGSDEQSAASIPASFHGEWTSDPATCGTGLSDSRLRIDAARLRFHESIGTVREVVVVSESVIDVTADYSGEGETWRNIRRLGLAPGGKNLTVAGDGSTMMRVRCP